MLASVHGLVFSFLFFADGTRKKQQIVFVSWKLTMNLICALFCAFLWDSICGIEFSFSFLLRIPHFHDATTHFFCFVLLRILKLAYITVRFQHHCYVIAVMLRDGKWSDTQFRQHVANTPNGYDYVFHLPFWNMNQPHLKALKNASLFFFCYGKNNILSRATAHYAAHIANETLLAHIKGIINKNKHDINYTRKFSKCHISLALIFIKPFRTVTF